MLSSIQQSVPPSFREWQMPIVPESYDRSSLTRAEYLALEQTCHTITSAEGLKNPGSSVSIQARKILARLDLPIADVFRLRHHGRCTRIMLDVQRIMQREMYRHGKAFWDWSEAEWMDTLCPTLTAFGRRYPNNPSGCRPTLMDAAYLLGGISDLRPTGIRLTVSEAANVYFGKELMYQQCQKVLEGLRGKGYTNSRTSAQCIRQCLSMLFILNRSPYLENISQELLESVSRESEHMRQACQRTAIGLQGLRLFVVAPPERLETPHRFDDTDMSPEWYAWCMAWYDCTADLTPNIRRHYANTLLGVGRWLYQHVPEVCTPEQWTEDLALHFRSDLYSWTKGQYASTKGKQNLQYQGKLDKPLTAKGAEEYLMALRRYFTDLARYPHTVQGKPAYRINLDFRPQEVFTTPRHIRQILDEADPRDIDLRVWAKLVIAAATLSSSDLPAGAQYPLSFYRALALVWVASARRPNEIIRLQLDCLREEWEPGMLDEDDQPVENIPSVDPNPREKTPKLYYLQIPAGKQRGSFWIWIPDYVADAIEAWKRERPQQQRQLLDLKDRKEVDYLFCYRDVRVGVHFLNRSIIPALCAKAGVEIEDAKGKITGHRGRSTRLTLLRANGVGLEDLAEYAGHADTKTIRRYARQHPLQLHRIIRAADDVSRIIEGVVDLHAAAQGLPALRWFIGFDADGEPMYCGNQSYVTCPHRLDCERCGMFVGGEKAKLLHEGKNALPITSTAPMTPLEKCVVEENQEGAKACRATLQQVPAPETPDIHLIFNPEGLSDHELEKLAELGTELSLDKLQQACEAHEKRLEAMLQHKTGRSALVRAQKKRVEFIQNLVATCEQRFHEPNSS